MPNKNYIRGRKFEYDVMEMHRKNGALEVYRTAGSHGSYDIICFYDDRVELIQCKTKLTKAPFKGIIIRRTEEYIWPEQIQVKNYKLTKYIRRTK